MRKRTEPNQIKIYQDYAEIVLYDKDKKEVARTKVDLDDIDRLKAFKWSYNKKGYAYSWKVGQLHRFILQASSEKVVDHINSDSLDNRKVNLRLCDQQQNCCNRRKQKTSKSPYKNISWEASKERWRVNIMCKGIKYKKDFKELNDALNWRNAVLLDLHGEFAKFD